MNKPHKHAEAIKAWADGAEIECRDADCNWHMVNSPGWYDDVQYRVKPVSTLSPMAEKLISNF